MPIQWRNQIWQSLEEGARKRCLECGCDPVDGTVKSKSLSSCSYQTRKRLKRIYIRTKHNMQILFRVISCIKLQNDTTVKRQKIIMKKIMRWRAKPLICFWLSSAVLISPGLTFCTVCSNFLCKIRSSNTHL